jgi:hypothetical protein
MKIGDLWKLYLALYSDREGTMAEQKRYFTCAPGNEDAYSLIRREDSSEKLTVGDVMRMLEMGFTTAERELIDAVLEWRGSNPNRPLSYIPLTQKVAVAADAVLAERAPKPRYSVRESYPPPDHVCVIDNEPSDVQSVVVARCQNRPDANMIVDALNAANNRAAKEE